jgi:hypothetical protein
MRIGAVGWVDWYVGRCLERHPALREGYDVAFVNQPRIFGPRCYHALRTRARHIVNYVNDDPFGRGSDPCWRLFLEALPLNDLVAVSREVNVPEANAMGARRVVRVHFAADEALHRPLDLTAEERAKWSSEVLFIGTCFPERGPFVRELIERQVPIAIYGNGWDASPDWSIIRPHYRGKAIHGENYVTLIQCAKIAIGLVSKDNRDQSTTRSMEIPAIGTLLCAERTDEHRQLYEEGKEAVFFDDAAECASVCRQLLDDDARRREIASAGHRRFLLNGTTNQSILKRILDALEESSPPKRTTS